MTDETRTWRRVSRGVIWITFGTFLLLTTLDVLPWSYWWSLVPFWPVLLVMLGLRLIFSRSRVPALVLLSPLLLIATMTWVAVSGSGWPTGPAWPVEISRTPDAERWTFQGDLAMVELDLRAAGLGPDLLLEGETRGHRGRPDLLLSGGDLRPRLRVRNFRGGRLLPWQSSWWGELRGTIAADLPLDLDLDGGMVRGRVDLTGVPLERARLDGAFQDLTLALGPPEVDTTIRLRGAFNRLKLVVPDETPVRSWTDGLFNVVAGRREASRLRGPAYRLDVEGLLNWVEVRSP